MKKSLQTFIVSICLAFSSLLMHAHAQMDAPAAAQIDADASIVTAVQYCAFLNHIAPSDVIAAEAVQRHFRAGGNQDNMALNLVYDEHMASDPSAACIARIGAPGSYHYEVIAGRENFPITYVSEFDEAAFAAGEQVTGYRLQKDEAGDASLRSNLSSFAVDDSSSPTLTLAAADSTSTSNLNPYIKDVSQVAGLIALIASPELMMRMGGDAGRASGEESEMDGSDHGSDVESIHSCASSQSAVSARTTASMGKKNQYSLGLVDFTAAALEHPMADRLVIDEGDTEAIIPSKASLNPLNFSKNAKENKTITLAFKDVLRTEYGRELAERLLPGQRSSMFDSFSLSSAKIFQYVNKVERRITENHILATKESDLDVLNSHVERKKINVGETEEFYEKHQAELENRNQEKSLLEKSESAVSYSANAIGNAHILGLPVGALATTVYDASVAINKAIESKPMKLAKKIAEGAKEDLSIVEKRMVAVQRKEAKKNSTNTAKRGVRFDDPSPETISSVMQGKAVATQEPIAQVGRGRMKVENDHMALWEEAVRLESAAEFAEFKISKSDTSANREAYVEACRLAKMAWTTAAVAREAASNKAVQAMDKNRLMADTTTAEEKADEWGRALNGARAKYNGGNDLSASDNFSRKVTTDTTVTADASTLEERLAAMESALREANEKALLLETKKNEAIAAKSKMGTRVVESKKTENALKSEIEILKAELQTSKEAGAARQQSHSAVKETHAVAIADIERLTTEVESAGDSSPEQKIDSKADPAARKDEIEKIPDTAHETKKDFSDETAWADALKASEAAEIAWTQAHATCAAAGSVWFEMADQVAASYERAVEPSRIAEAAWATAVQAKITVVQAKITVLEKAIATFENRVQPAGSNQDLQASVNKAKDFKDLKASLDDEINKAKAEQTAWASQQAAWASNATQAEKIAQDVRDSKNMSIDEKNKIITAKTAFVTAKTAWVDFSRSVQVFTAHPNTANYTTATATATAASNALTAAASAANNAYSAAATAAAAAARNAAYSQALRNSYKSSGAFLDSVAHNAASAANPAIGAANAALCAADAANANVKAKASSEDAASAARAAYYNRMMPDINRRRTEHDYKEHAPKANAAGKAVRDAYAANPTAATAAYAAARAASAKATSYTSANTMWCEDQAWAARAAQEGADFHEAVAKWRKKKEEGCIIQ